MIIAPRQSALFHLIASTVLAVSTVCGAEQPGDHLSPEEDSAAYKSCGGAAPETGAQVLRVVPAGPRREDGSLAFVPGVCVYLPPGYDESGLRYPVIYYLHGGGGQQGSRYDDVFLSAQLADDSNAVIKVSPDGSGLAAWFDRFDNNNTSVQNWNYQEQGPGYGRTLNETYVLDWVIPFIDRHYRTIPRRGGRALWGISNGGHGAVLLAAKRPHMFTAVSVLSGNMAWQSVTMSQELILDPDSGDFSPVYRAGNIPSNLTTNLDHVDLMFDVGSSFDPAHPDLLYEFTFEQLFVPGNRDLQSSLNAVQHIGDNDYREQPGGHSGVWWRPWLEERHLPFLLQRLADPQANNAPLPEDVVPTTFRYRSISDHFVAWDYEVTVSRGVREFLDLQVDGDTVTVTGTGLAEIKTAPKYMPGEIYAVHGHNDLENPTQIEADTQGRLTIEFDLGPASLIEDPAYFADNAFVSNPTAPFAGTLPRFQRIATISRASPDLAPRASEPHSGGATSWLTLMICGLLSARRRRWPERFPQGGKRSLP